MADFRRWTLVLAIFALFAGLASAQGVSTGMSCNVTSVPTDVRPEGYTELLGDILITCSGGTSQAIGTPVKTVNINVRLSGAVFTSRLLQASTRASEALLFIDDPQSGEGFKVTGFGPDAPQIPCANVAVANAGCPAITADQVGTDGNHYAVTVDATKTTTAAANIYQGVYSTTMDQISFNGVPVLPAVTTGVTRTFRIKNLRGFAKTSIVNALISVSNTTVLPVQNAQVQVASVQDPSLLASSKVSKTFQQCIATSGSAEVASVLNFKERETFLTAFKSRVDASTDLIYNAESDGGGQTNPVGSYSSESGVVIPVVGGTAGLATSGTRFTATFANIPAGLTLYVSTRAVNAAGTDLNAPKAQIVGGLGTASDAVMVSSETADNTDGAAVVDATTSLDLGGVQKVPVVEVPSSGKVVWEVTNSSPAAQDSLNFGVYVAYTPNTAKNEPTPTTAPAPQVSLNYANVGTAAAWALPSATLPIPRFTRTPDTGNYISITFCQTTLFWPYVITLPDAGWDTGLAIANTSSYPDPAAGQNGTCELAFYNADPTDATTGQVQKVTVPLSTESSKLIYAGTVYANDANSILTAGSFSNSFSGFVIAACNFQYAHGYAAVLNSSSGSLSGYLALVLDSNINDGSSLGGRGTAGEVLGN